MGHYWREMDPDGAAEQDRRHEVNNNIKSLQKQLRSYPARSFTVQDILDIGLDVNANWEKDNTEVLDRLIAAHKRAGRGYSL